MNEGNRYKYFLPINQKVFVENFPEVDFVGACVFEVIKSWCYLSSERVYRETHDDIKYTWIDYSEIVRELPLLRLESTFAVRSRVQVLINAGLIKTKASSSDEGRRRILFSLTEKAEIFEYVYPLNSSIPKNPVILESQGAQVIPESSIQEPLSPVSLEKRPISVELSLFPNIVENKLLKNTPVDEVKKDDKYKSGYDEATAEDVAKKLVELFSSEISVVHRKNKAVSRMKELLKDYRGKELKQIIMNKTKDDWFMEHLSVRGFTWFFSSNKRLEKYLDEE